MKGIVVLTTSREACSQKPHVEGPPVNHAVTTCRDVDAVLTIYRAVLQGIGTG